MENLSTVISVALVLATLFTLWNPANLFSNQSLERAFLALQSTSLPQQAISQATPSDRMRIGIVSGHHNNISEDGVPDPGAVCTDTGLTEEEVNYQIAYLVYESLTAQGYQVDLLDEFDSRLTLYQAAALVSIHADSCEYLGDSMTGFKVAPSSASAQSSESLRLASCIAARYGEATGLPQSPTTITPDMTEYHAFTEIYSSTAAAIIETGFLNLDRDFLTSHQDIAADGIVQGILCYIRNENIEPSAAP
jgi:N-acetylmuramoyl-L-alanine amidase